MNPDEHRIRMTDFDIRNSLRALAMIGISTKERREVFDHLLLTHRRVVMAQMKSLDERSKVTGKWSDEEIIAIADALRETRMYPSSRFPRKMQLYKRAIEEGTRFNAAWNLELRKRKTYRRSSANYSWHEEEEDEEDYRGEFEDEAEIQERKGYHREHGDWGRLLDQDGEEVEEDLSRGKDGWLYNDDGTRISRWREDAEEYDS